MRVDFCSDRVMKTIDGEKLVDWLQRNMEDIKGDWKLLGPLFCTGATVTYEKVIDYVNDLMRMDKEDIEFRNVDLLRDGDDF